MFTDFVLASLHHVLIFAMMAVIAVELVMVRQGLGGASLRRLAGIDGAFGALALAIVVVGVCRVIFGLKGWEAYVHNVWFWHKMAAFAIAALLSAVPTIRFLRWRRAAASDTAFVVPEAEIRTVRRFLHGEAGVFLLIPIFAAAMARYGY
jgi:putative membrane protein